MRDSWMDSSCMAGLPIRERMKVSSGKRPWRELRRMDCMVLARSLEISSAVAKAVAARLGRAWSSAAQPVA